MGKRKLKSLNEIKYTFNEFNVVNSAVRQPQTIDAFYREELVGSDGDLMTVYHDDIYMLFNQQRLSKLMNSADLVAYVNSLSKSSDSITNKLTDEQLFEFIKSRHIQSPAELLSWSQYLINNYEDVIAELEKGGVNNAETTVVEGTNNNVSEGSN